MKQSSERRSSEKIKGTRNIQRIWWLSIIAICTCCITNYLFMASTSDLRRELYSQTKIATELQEAENQIHDWIHASHRDSFDLLHDPSICDHVPTWVDTPPRIELESVSYHEKQLTGLFIDRLLSHHPQLVDHYRRVSEWARQWILTEEIYLQTDKKSEAAIVRFVSNVHELAGINELALTSTIRQGLTKPGVESHSQELSLARQSSRWNNLIHEVDDLALIKSQIQGLHSIEAISDKRDNQLGASIRRMHRWLDQLEPETAYRESFQSQLHAIESHLLGCPFQWDEGKQAVHVEDPGLLAILEKRLKLRDENRQLELELNTKEAAIRGSLSDLRQHILTLANTRELVNRQMARQATQTAWLVSCGGLIVLIGFTTSIHRIVRNQVRLNEQHVEELILSERKLRVSEERFMHAASNAKLGVWEWNLKTDQIWMNDDWWAMMGLPPQESSQAWNRLRASIHPADRMHFETSMQELVEGKSEEWKLHYRWQCENGTHRSLHLIGRVGERDSDGQPMVLSGIQIDETERLELENHLDRSSKMESIGQLAAGVAHEINTPTQYIGHHIAFIKDAVHDISQFLECVGPNRKVDEAELLQKYEDADIEYLLAEMPRSAEQSLEGIQRISRIIQSLKEFTHPGQERANVDLCQVLRTIVNISTNEWKYIAEVELDLPNDELIVEADVGELHQVFLNLIINAAHAIEEKHGPSSSIKGKIRIEARSTWDGVCVTVSDDGCGMNSEVQKKIFDPFFTTKAIGKGTGQGLAIVHRIMEHHHAEIDVQSEVGKGTTMRILFPQNATVFC